MELKVNLVRVEGPTSIYIDAEIADTGDLLLSGQDVGQAPSELFGHSDYEYWLRIPATKKDELLLALMQRHYSDNTSVISEFNEYLESVGIPCKFSFPIGSTS